MEERLSLTLCLLTLLSKIAYGIALVGLILSSTAALAC